MGIMIDGTILSARGANLTNLINGYINKKQQTLQALYEQQSAIEEMYNTVASGLYTTQSSIYQLNTYYNNQILAKNSSINNLQAQIKLADNKISALNTMHNSFRTTVTSLDDFLDSVRASANASSTIDFTNSNTSALEVSIVNSDNLSTQRIEYDVKQIATATQATSYVLNGYNLTRNTLVKDIFAGTYDSSILTGTRTNLDESITMKQLGITEGRWDIGTTTLYISQNDTLGDIANQLKADNFNAGVRNGQFFIDGRNIKDMNIHNQESNFGEVLGLTVSTGNFSINGQNIDIDDDTTIQNLLDTINSTDCGVGAFFDNNQLSLVANLTGNVMIEITKGSSNFTNIAGFTVGGSMIEENLTLGADGSKQTISGSINISDVIGNISSGEFVLSKTFNGVTTKEVITVTQGANLQETLNNVIAQINASSLNVTASLENDKFVVTNNVLGAGYSFAFEAGDSDFTDKLGFSNPIVETGTPSYDNNTIFFTTLTGMTDVASLSDNVVTAGSFKINGTTINLSAGTFQDAIDTINTYTNTTGVIAEHKNGHLILRNEYTGDTTITVDGGTSNFGEIAGFTTLSINSATATYGQVGTKSTLTGAETVSSSLAIGDSVITINGTTVNINAGTLADVVNQLNTDYSDTLNLDFAISAENKLVLTEQRNGELPITVSSVSGNFAELTGISGYQTRIGTEEKYGSSKTIFTAARNVSNNTQILDSEVNINGHQLALSGTIADAILTINANSATTGIEAYIDTDNKFTLRNTAAGSTDILFNVMSGDFGRVVGTGTYSTVGGSTTRTDRVLASVTGANTGLNEFSQVLAGSKIQFGATIIDLGASVGAALLAINNNKDITGVEAFLNENGQFVMQATNDEMESIAFSVIGSGDFGRVTGLGSYTVGAADSNGEIINESFSKITGVNEVSNTTEITATKITLHYVNDLGTNVTKTFELSDGTLESAMQTINNSNWYVKAEIVDNKFQFVSRSAGTFQIGLTVNSVDGVTGDFGRVVGMGNNISGSGSTSNLSKDPAKYEGSATGLNATDELIGTNTIRLWMTRTLPGTGVNTEGGSGSLESMEATVTFVDKDSDGKISIQDAINSINDVKSITKIEASLVDGRFVLTQIDANTAGEGDTINFVLSGDGDFARVAGYGTYTTIGEANTGTVIGQSFTTLVGSRDISSTNEVLSGSFTLTLTKGDAINSPAVNLTTTINVADGTMQNAIDSINSQLTAAGIAVTASIVDNKLQFKSDIAGNYNIAVNMDNSDFGRVVGIGSHSTSNGTATSVEKTAARVTGGVTGLTRDSGIVGNMQLTLQGIVTRMNTGMNTEGGTNNVLSSVRTINISGTIGDAIDAINAQSSSTQICAYLDAQGRFILEQTNQNTECEFDTISFNLAGTGDFGAVTGLGAYVTYGYSGDGVTAGRSYSSIEGVVENLKGTEQITAGTITINFADDVNSWDAPTNQSLTININGTVENAIQQINNAVTAAGYTYNAYIDSNTGRLVLKSTSYGADSFNVTVQGSDFARITGIANYTMDYADVTSASSTYNMHPVLTGGNEVNEDTIVMNGTLVIEGNTISTVNKTISQIVNEVNNLGIAGVTADIETGYFRIKMLENAVGNPVDIQATADFARVTGLGAYSIESATYVDGSYTTSDGTPSHITKSVTGLSDTARFVGGSITIDYSDGLGGTNSISVDAAGKTAQQVVNEINAQSEAVPSIDSIEGYSLNRVFATYENGQITIKTNENSHTITATGDFARVTGFSEYRAGSAQTTAATTSEQEGTIRFTSKNSTVLSSSTRFTDGKLYLTFENGVNGDVTIDYNAAGKTVSDVVTDLNNLLNSYYSGYSVDGYLTTKPLVSFNEATGKISIITYGTDHYIQATGNFAALTGFDSDYISYNTQMKPIVTYQKDGTLTGATDVNTANGQAIIGQAGTIDFYNGSSKIGTVNVSATDSLNDVLTKINSMVVNNPAPADTFNVNYDTSISASIVDGKIQLSYGAGMDSLTVSGTSAFVYFYGLSTNETQMSARSTYYDVSNNDVYVYTNGSITGSVDVKDMLTTGSLTVGATEIGPFAGQRNGTLTFVSDVTGSMQAIGNVEVLATDTLDDIMNKINNLTTVNLVTPLGVEINKIDGFTASFTADGKIQITYGGQQGAVRIQDSSGFSQHYGLTDADQNIYANAVYTEEERPYPDVVGQSVVTGSTKGYNDSTVVGGLQSGTLSISLNNKNITVSYTNTESLSTILGRIIETANQTDGSGLFDYNGELDQNILSLGTDKMTYSLNADGQIVLTGGVELRTPDQFVISDLSGNFARITGIATTPEGYTPPAGVPTPSPIPGLSVFGTSYIVTPYSQSGSHGTYSFTGASVNGLSGSSVLSGLQNGGFYLETTSGNKWVTVNAGDSVNTILGRINALDNANIHATFDEANNRIRITATNNALDKISITGDTSGFVNRAGLNKAGANIDANYTNTQESFGHAKIWSSVDNLHATHILGNIQGGVNGATETVTLTDGECSVNITIGDDESLNSIIQKIIDTGKFDAGITDGKMWIKSLADSSEEIGISNSNFARILGFKGNGEVLNNGLLTVGAYGTMNYTGGAISSLMGSSNLTIDSSLTGTGDGSFKVTLSDKNADTVAVNTLAFDVSVTKDMTVNDIMNAIRTAAVNAGVVDMDIYFDNSTHQVKVSVSGNQAEQITFTGNDEKGTELIKRLGLATSNTVMINNGTNTLETSGYTRFTGSVSGLHGSHVMGNLASGTSGTETFTISGPNGSSTITVSDGQSLSQIIAAISAQSGGNYSAGIDSDGKFFIQSTAVSGTAIRVSSSDFTKRVGLVASNETQGPSAQTYSGSHGYFEFYGAGGTGGSGIDGMTGATVFTGMRNGSFKFTLGGTSINGPDGTLTYHDSRTFTVNVSSTDTVQSVLNKMKTAITTAGGYSASDMQFEVEVDSITHKGRVHIKMNGKDASEIVFSDDTTGVAGGPGFVEMAGLSNTGASTSASYTSVNRSYGKSGLTGSLTGLNQDHVFGNMQAGTMVISAGSTTKTINITATDSITDIAQKIENGGQFVSGLDENGSFFVRTTGDNAANVTISGTSDFYKLVGMNSGNWSYTESYSAGSFGNSKITGSVTGLTADQKFNNMTSGTFTISAAGLRTLTVNVSAGNTKISDVIDYINNTATSDYEAELNGDGQLVIKTKVSNGATITVKNGTSNYAQLMGLTAGTISNASTTVVGQSDKYSTLTGSTTGLSTLARFASGDFIVHVKSPEGVTSSQTFSLTGSENLSTILATISNSTLGITGTIDEVTGQVVFTAKEVGEYEISLEDGTTNFAEATGLTRNHSQIQDADRGSLAQLTSTKTYLSAEFLGYTAGTFFISLTDRNNNITATQKITVAEGDTTAQIAQKISDSGIGIRADVDASTGKLVLTRTSSTTEGGIRVEKGTSDFTNKIGFTAGGEQSPSSIIQEGTDATNAVFKGATITSANLSTTLGALGISDGTIIINNTLINVSQSDTIQDFINHINNAFSPTDANGVTAQYSGNKIVLTSNIKATNARINVEAGTSNASSVLGFTNGTTLNTANESIGLNSIIKINGADYESRFNTVSIDADANVVAEGSPEEALKLTLQALGNGVIDIGKMSVDETYLKLLTFANNFNSAMILAQNPSLSEDAGFQSLINSLRSSLTSDIGSITKVERELGNIGISLQSTLTATGNTRMSLLINKDKFETAMLTNTSKVMDLLIGDDSEPLDYTEAGAFVRLKEDMDYTLKPISGYFKANSRIITTQRNALQKELTMEKGDLAELEAELAIVEKDNEAVKQKEELENFLKEITEQYKTISELINKLNKQYTQSLSVLVVNKNNQAFS